MPQEQSDKSNDKVELISSIPIQSIKCWMCHKSHRLMNCFKFFLKKSLKKRKELIKRNFAKAIY